MYKPIESKLKRLCISDKVPCNEQPKQQVSCSAPDDTGCIIATMHSGETNTVKSNVVVDAVGVSNYASGAVNNASDVIDICGDGRYYGLGQRW